MMGEVISFFKYGEIESQKLVVYCEVFKDLESKAISVNELLSKKLITTKLERRTMRLDRFFNEIIETLPDDSVIKDFDVMFNPAYKVDVLRILEIASKRKKYSVIWPGKFKDGNLIYADLGYKDYKTYDINEYDIICVV